MNIGLIGFGEVGGILATDLKARGADVAAWDLLMAQPAMREKARAAGIEACESSAALVGRSQVVISAVTASNTLAAAREAAQAIGHGTFFLDLNSASPGTKQSCAQAIDAAGGHYVEAGVMTSLPPYRIKVPMVVGGARAPELIEKLAPYGFAMEFVSESLGVASAIKMCRSVMIKGLEAIFIESYSTARRYGVEERVLESFKETFPNFQWEKEGAYFFSRVVQHGKRRAEEMREAAVTVREAGFDPFMAAATAEKQDQVAKLAAKGVFAGLAPGADWREYADRLIRENAPSAQDRKKSA